MQKSKQFLQFLKSLKFRLILLIVVIAVVPSLILSAAVLKYYEKRAAAYPPVEEYLDAQVKINSGDADMVAAGQAQLEAYYQACLAVKAKYPKPEETESQDNV